MLEENLARYEKLCFVRWLEGKPPYLPPQPYGSEAAKRVRWKAKRVYRKFLLNPRVRGD